ncbi:MAG: ribonuclease III [Bacteroidia bacterium]|nr:ribonuclease III [Bacteroidia bacterium]
MIKEIKSRIRFFFSKKEEPYFHLKKMLGFTPINMEYYNLALLHRSTYIKTATGDTLNNERLEYLGDAILSAAVSDILYEEFPNKKEGELTCIRSRLVQRATLDDLAVKLGLDLMVISDKRSTQNFQKVHINGNAFEALMGAIYLDRGFAKCKFFINKIVLEKYIDLYQTVENEVNFKSRFIEWAQRYKYQYNFIVADVNYDKAHNVSIFHSKIEVEGIIVGSGHGLSKKESQQEAAEKAIQTIKTKSFKAQLKKRKEEQEVTEPKTDTKKKTLKKTITD